MNKGEEIWFKWLMDNTAVTMQDYHLIADLRRRKLLRLPDEWPELSDINKGTDEPNGVTDG